MPLANGRRADILAVGRDGAIWIVEIKSSIADFRADQKWPEYRDYCDALLFAVAPDFPSDILPADTGLIFADAYAGEVVRQASAPPIEPGPAQGANAVDCANGGDAPARAARSGPWTVWSRKTGSGLTSARALRKCAAACADACSDRRAVSETLRLHSS